MTQNNIGSGSLWGRVYPTLLGITIAAALWGGYLAFIRARAWVERKHEAYIIRELQEAVDQDEIKPELRSIILYAVTSELAKRKVKIYGDKDRRTTKVDASTPLTPEQYQQALYQALVREEFLEETLNDLRVKIEVAGESVF